MLAGIGQDDSIMPQFDNGWAKRMGNVKNNPKTQKRKGKLKSFASRRLWVEKMTQESTPAQQSPAAAE
jgi:hypothetical protein